MFSGHLNHKHYIKASLCSAKEHSVSKQIHNRTSKPENRMSRLDLETF